MARALLQALVPLFTVSPTVPYKSFLAALALIRREDAQLVVMAVIAHCILQHLTTFHVTGAHAVKTARATHHMTSMLRRRRDTCLQLFR